MNKSQTSSPGPRLVGNALIALGAVVTTVGSQMQLAANLTGPGSYLGSSVEHQELMWVASNGVLPAAPLESTNPVGVLAFGMVMMLVGFGLHAWLVMHQQDEKTVPVRAKKKQKKQRSSRKQMEVIWVERTIRF